MSLELIGVVWDELKRYINTVDRADAAENFLTILIDNDFDPEDIRDAFKGDSDIKRALASYLEKYEDEEEYEEYEDEEEDEDY